MKKCMFMFILLLLTIVIATMSERKDEKILSYSLTDKEVSLNNAILSQNDQGTRTAYEEPSSEPLE